MLQSTWLFNELRKIIELPEDCIAVSLDLQVGELPTVKVVRRVRGSGHPEEVTEKFALVRIDDTPYPKVIDPREVSEGRSCNQ